MKKIILILVIVIHGTILAQNSEMVLADYIKKKLQFKRYITPSLNFSIIQFKNPKVAPILIECLEVRRQRADNISVRHNIIVKLGEFKYQAAVPILLAILEGEDPWWVKSVAIEALMKIGDKKTIPAIVKSMDISNAMVQKRAAIALQKMTGHKTKIKISIKSSSKKIVKAIKFWKRWHQKNKGKKRTHKKTRK